MDSGIQRGGCDCRQRSRGTAHIHGLQEQTCGIHLRRCEDGRLTHLQILVAVSLCYQLRGRYGNGGRLRVRLIDSQRDGLTGREEFSAEESHINCVAGKFGGEWHSVLEGI